MGGGRAYQDIEQPQPKGKDRDNEDQRCQASIPKRLSRCGGECGIAVDKAIFCYWYWRENRPHQNGKPGPEPGQSSNGEPAQQRVLLLYARLQPAKHSQAQRGELGEEHTTRRGEIDEEDAEPPKDQPCR